MKLPTPTVITWMMFCFVTLKVTSTACGQVEAFDPPPIHSQGDSRFGKPPTRPQSLADVVAEIVTIGKRGTWKLDKRWEIIINSLQSAEVPTLLDAVAKLAPSDAREGLRAALYSRWAETDPSAAMMRIAKEVDPVVRGICLQALFQGWAHANATELEAWAQPLEPGNVKMLAYMAATPYTAANETKNSAVSNTDRAPKSASLDPRSALAEAAKILDRERRLTVYKSILREWAATDPAVATQWAMELPIQTEREALIELATTTWARIDAGRAAAFMVEHREVSRYLLERAVSAWAARDAAGVMRWARGLSGTQRRVEVLAALVPALIDQFPDDAIEFIAMMPTESYEFSNTASSAISRWAETNPQRVFALWRKLPSDAVSRLQGPELLQMLVRSSAEPLFDFLRGLPVGQRANPYATAVGALAVKDVAAARKQLVALSGASDEQAVRRILLQSMIEKNFDFALELYPGIPAGQAQTEALQMIAGQWSRKDPMKALAWVRALPSSPLTQNAVQTIIRQLGQSDPKTALAELQSLPASSLRRGLTAELVATWATKDFAAARDYLQKIPEDEVREAALLATAQRMGYADPTKGLELLLNGETTNERMNAIQQIVSTWVQNDSAVAQRWAEGQPNVAMREIVLVANLYPLCQTSPAKAAAMIERLTLPQNVRQSVSIVAQSWTAFDPLAASRWATEHSAGPIRDQALVAVLGHWAQQDYRAATQWVSALLPDGVPDEAWAQLAQNTFGRQPRDAMRWAAQIKNAKKRDDTVVQYGSYWLRQNPIAAEAWLSESGLAAELIERIRKGAQPPMR